MAAALLDLAVELTTEDTVTPKPKSQEILSALCSSHHIQVGTPTPRRLPTPSPNVRTASRRPPKEASSESWSPSRTHLDPVGELMKTSHRKGETSDTQTQTTTMPSLEYSNPVRIVVDQTCSNWNPQPPRLLTGRGRMSDEDFNWREEFDLPEPDTNRTSGRSHTKAGWKPRRFRGNQ